MNTSTILGKKSISVSNSAFILKQLISNIYTGGIDRVLKFDLTPTGGITGYFNDFDDLYEFEISPKGQLSYIEVDLKQFKTDSYLIGYYTDSELDRVTKIRTDKKNRKQCVQGKPCKGTCIAKGIKCRSQLSPNETRHFFTVRNALAVSKGVSLPKGTLGSVAIAGAIAGAGVAGAAIARRNISASNNTSLTTQDLESRRRLKELDVVKRQLNNKLADETDNKRVKQEATKFMETIFSDPSTREIILQNPKARAELLGMIKEIASASAGRSFRDNRERIIQLLENKFGNNSSSKDKTIKTPPVKNTGFSVGEKEVSTALITTNNLLRQPRRRSSWKKAALVGASTVGVPVVSYLALRSKYRSGFKESAEIAKQQANSVKVPSDITGDLLFDGKSITRSRSRLKQANQITFVVGGFGGEEGYNSVRWAKEFKEGIGSDESSTTKREKSTLFDDHHIVAVNNADFDIDSSSTPEQQVERGVELMLRTTLKKGRNLTAVKTAAMAYAYYEKHKLPINLIGYSGGGMATHEAAEILKEMGVEVKVANFASPYWGLTKKVGNSITFVSPNDNASQNRPIREPINIKSVKNHFSYLRNEEVRSKLKDFFDGKLITEKSREQLTSEEKAKAKRKREQLKRIKAAKARKASRLQQRA